MVLMAVGICNPLLSNIYTEKIFGGVAVLAIAMAVAFNVNLNMSKTNQTSLLALANVEALADENGFIRIGNDNSKPYFEEQVITNVYNTTGSLEITVKGVTIKVGSFENNLVGFLTDCDWAFWGRCDHSQIGFTAV